MHFVAPLASVALWILELLYTQTLSDTCPTQEPHPQLQQRCPGMQGWNSTIPMQQHQAKASQAEHKKAFLTKILQAKFWDGLSFYLPFTSQSKY